MQLIHVKMRNGEDLIGYLGDQIDNSIELITPISVSIDPQFGMFAKSWLMFSDINSVMLTSSDYLFFAKASTKAVEYYEEFMFRLGNQESNLDTNFTNELEDIFSAIMESRNSKKH